MTKSISLANFAKADFDALMTLARQRGLHEWTPSTVPTSNILIGQGSADSSALRALIGDQQRGSTTGRAIEVIRPRETSTNPAAVAAAAAAAAARAADLARGIPQSPVTPEAESGLFHHFVAATSSRDGEAAAHTGPPVATERSGSLH